MNILAFEGAFVKILGRLTAKTKNLHKAFSSTKRRFVQIYGLDGAKETPETSCLRRCSKLDPCVALLMGRLCLYVLLGQ